MVMRFVKVIQLTGTVRTEYTRSSFCSILHSGTPTDSHTVCKLRNLETSILSNGSPVPCLFAPVLLLCRVNSGSVLYRAPHSKSCSSNDKTVDFTLG